MKKIYLDNSSSTPVDKEVLKEILPYFSDKYGNPSSLHFFGQEAQVALDVARKRVADALKADTGEIVFTGSATEANNLAILGSVKSWIKEYGNTVKPHIITSQLEHESVLEPIKYLQESRIADVDFIPVSKDGFISLDILKSELRKETALVSIMYANNEVGTIQPISEISKIIEEHNKKLSTINYNLPAGRHGLKTIFHTDASQAFNFLNCDVEKLGVDMLTVSGHKIYGPKGVGALYAKNRILLSSVIFGSGQERGLRSGTENIPAIAGLGKAAEIASLKRNYWEKEISVLRNKLKEGIFANIPNVIVNGSMENRIAHNLNIAFLGVNKEDLLIQLDLAGIAVSGGAACYSKAHKTSHVLTAMGVPEEWQRGSIRMTLGKYTTGDDIDYIILKLKESVEHLRSK